MSHRFASVLRLCFLFVLIAGVVFQPQYSVYALTTLTAEPLTWNVIGLDSNNVNVGPNHFPVGARVCNTGSEAATNVTATFVWDDGLNLYSGDPYINLRSGTLSTINLGALNSGACADAYFEVAVTRNASAYDKTRDYHINVTAGNVTGTISTPQPRELYVEHLVSQNRNAVTDVKYGTSLGSLTSIAAGGTMTLMVGNTYYIQLVGFTATQGYEQLEAFINIPNTIFQILSVSSTYDHPTNPYTIDKLYSDGCTWENDPNSPNYRHCLGTGKSGGSITVTYQVRILQIPSAPLVNPQPLSTLVYDFSGSSYHYNSDYDVSTRYANIVNASIEKSFSPKTITPGSNSTLTFTINNPGAETLNNVNFTDDLPTNVSLANANVSYSGCGSPSPTSGSLIDPLSFSNITVAGLGTCTIAVTVISNTNGTYANTTSTLKIGTTDTGDTASDSLVVSSAPALPTSCTSTRTTMATWTFENYSALAGNTITAGDNGPFDASSDVLTNTPTGVYRSSGSSASAIIDRDLAVPAGWTAPDTGNATTVWGIRQSWPTAIPADPTNPTSPFFEFQVNTDGLYGGLGITLDYDLVSASGWTNSGSWYVLYSTNGTIWSNLNTGSWAKTAWQTGGITATSTSSSTTVYFRIYFVGASAAQNVDANAYFDNVVISGCPNPPPPTISKSFGTDPIAVSGNSTLLFTISNTAPGASALNGVSFTDVLPGGLVINTPSGLTTTCTGVIAAAGTSTISMSGALAAGASCTISVSVVGNAAGSYTNTSTNITSTDSGPNTSTTPNVGFAQDTLVVVAPPVINKAFTANPIFTGNSTVLTFTISNPNTAALFGVQFSPAATGDTLPSGLVVANPNGLTGITCTTGSLTGTTIGAVAGSSNITMTGGILSAGANCSFSVNVTGTTVGLKSNSITIASTNGGTGNTDSASVLVKDPTPAISLLKEVGTTASGPWTSFLTSTIGGNVYYRLTVENTGDVTLTNISVSDLTVSAAGCSWVDGDGTVLGTQPFSLPVADAANNQIATCVLGPIAAVSGSHSNTATVTGTSATDLCPTSPDASCIATYGTPALTLVKSVTSGSPFTSAGNTITYSYLVTNSGFAPLLGPVSIADDKSSDESCPDLTTGGAGDNDDDDNWFEPGESITCTASYIVVPGDVAAGSVTNTATATVSNVNSNPDSETVYRIPDFTVSKANNVSGSVAQNGTFNWTITVSQISTGQGSFAIGQTILSDTLPGVDGYYTLVPLTVTPGGIAPSGTINCSIVTGPSLSCVASEAITFPAGSSFSVTFAVTPTTAGSLSNTATVDPGLVITELDETNNASTNVVTVVAPPSITKSFSPNPTAANVASTLTFTITNPNPGTDLTGVAFSDTYPSGLVNATPLATTNSCGGTLTTGADSISLNGGSITVNDVSCTITVSVVAATGGTYVNTTGNVSSTNGGTGNTATSTLNVFDAQPSKSIVTTSESSTGFVAGTERVTIGEMVRYRLAARIPEGSFTNVQLLDGLPTGLQFLNDGTATVAFVCNGGATCMTSSTLAGAGLVVSGSSSAVSPTFVAPSAAISAGPFGSGTDVTFSVGNITNSDADADSEYIVIEFNALVMNVNSTATINQGVDNQTGASNANNRQNDVTLLVNGAQVGATSPNVTVAIAEPAITAITKSVVPVASSYLPGDALTYTLSFSNNAVGNNATTAFDIVLSDTFNANLTLGTVNVSSTQGATCAGANAFSTSSSIVGQLVTVNVSCLDPGNSVTVTVNATIGAGTTSGTTISNAGNLTYTSLPGTQGHCASTTPPFSCSGVGGTGTSTGERNGSGGSGADTAVLNNYAVTSNTVNSTVAFGSITITKDAVPNDAQDFTFTGSGSNSYNFGGGFSLDDDADGTLPNTQTFNNLVPGNYSVTETGLIFLNWSLTGLTCTDPDSGSTTDLLTATATIDLDAGENVSCTFTNTGQIPDLSLAKTNGATSVTAGGTTTYTLTVTNSGTGDSVGMITIMDVLPTGLSIANGVVSLGGSQAANWTCNAASNVITCTSPNSIASNGGTSVFNFTVNVDANASGTLLNVAQVGGGGDPTNPNPPTSTTAGQCTATNTPNEGCAVDGDTVDVIADLSVTKTDGVPAVTAGGTTTYTIIVTNNGPSAVTGATITDTFPVDITSSSWTCAASVGSTCGAANGTGNIATTADLLVNGTVTFAVTANISATATGTLANMVTVGTPAGTTDPTPGNNTATDTDTVTPQTADLSLTKTVNNATPNVGTDVTFTVTISNAGAGNATTVAVSDVLPAGLTFVSSVPSQGSYNSGTGVWTVGTLNNGANATLTITATVTTTGAKTNTAQVSASDQSDPDSTPNNNIPNEDDQASATVTPGAVIDTSLDKQVSDATPNVGDIVTFTLVIANAGPSTATNINVTDIVPSGYTYLAASSAGGDTNNDTNPATTGLTWTINSLASGVSVNLTYQATVLASGTYENYAEITSHTETDSDSTPGDGSTTDDDDDTEIVAVTIIVDPAMSKAGSPTQAAVGETVTFTLTVTNNGNAPAPNVVITDVLPAMFDVTAVNVSGVGVPFGTSVNVTPAIGVGPAPYTVVVTLGGDLDVTDVVVIDIVTTVNGLGNPPINNTASLTTSNQLTNLLSNDSDSVTITIRTPNLAVASLPSTGFAPDVETEVLPQPKNLAYADTDLLLEIPSLGVKIPIVGIQKKNGAWDVSWLGKQAGWLTGTAFPSWSGNSLLTSHVYLSNGLPGPFVNLNKLKYGDKIIVHAYGQKYTFEVRTNQVVEPNDTSAFKHEERSWLTLITCKEYDEKTNTYKKRVVVRAVLVSVADE